MNQVQIEGCPPSSTHHNMLYRTPFSSSLLGNVRPPNLWSRWNLLTWNYATRGCKKCPCFSNSCFPIFFGGSLHQSSDSCHRATALDSSSLPDTLTELTAATAFRMLLACHRSPRIGTTTSWSVFVMKHPIYGFMCLYHSIYSRDVWKVYWIYCACHPCAGAMLIFSVPFQFYRMIPEGNL